MTQEERHEQRWQQQHQWHRWQHSEFDGEHGREHDRKYGRRLRAVLSLRAEPTSVADLFASAAGVSQWWGPTEGDGRPGGVMTTRFGEYGVNAMRVVEAGPSRVVWEPVVPEGAQPTGHLQEWLGTTVEFDLTPTDCGTELRFRHAGLTPRLKCFGECSAAWTHFLASIRGCAETGTGTPFEG